MWLEIDIGAESLQKQFSSEYSIWLVKKGLIFSLENFHVPIEQNQLKLNGKP